MAPLGIPPAEQVPTVIMITYNIFICTAYMLTYLIFSIKIINMVTKNSATNPPVQCPSCQGPLNIRELECESCDMQIRGHFGSNARFETLTADQMRFLETFLACRGVIRDVEAALSISYPTVKSRLDSLLAQLGLGSRPAADPGRSGDSSAERTRILADLEAGKMEPAAAISKLNELKKSP